MKLFIRLNKYLFAHKWSIILGAIFIIISKIFSIYPARLISESFDEVEVMLRNTTADFNQSALISKITTYTLMIIGAAIINGFFLFLTRQTIIVVSRRIEFEMKNEIFNHYQALNSSFYKRNNTGDLMNRISEDVSAVRMYFGPAIMYTINLVILFILVISTMIAINPTLTAYCLTPLPILAIIIYHVSKTIHHKSKVVQAQLSSLSTIAQETFSGIRVIKSFSVANYQINKFSTHTNKYKDLSLSLAKTNALFFPFMILLIGLSTILTIYIGGKLSIAGEVSTGNIAEFVIYVNMLTWPVASLGWVTSLTQRALASYERIVEFLNEAPEIKNPLPALPFNNGDIVFKNLSYTYPDTGIKAIDNIEFKIKLGSTIGIVGKTGSGKSTLANLLSRSIDPNSGSISINEQQLNKTDLSSLRESIGYVPQDVFLFSDTIKNNITFGLKEEADFSLIEKAAKDAEVYHNIIDLPQKFDTILGERGVNLSGGQKQRISIARGIIKSPDILIFDDCLSAVDTDTEHKIIKNLSKIMHGKTSIIISQRVSSIKGAGHIIVLDHGKIIQSGTHDELKVKEGVYNQLYAKQKRKSPEE